VAQPAVHLLELNLFLFALLLPYRQQPTLHTGIGTAIEFWKVTKAMDVSVSTSFPYLSIKDRASYSNNPTKEYDRTAMRYLSYALYPLVIGYSIYALMYETHKSWYSWLLGSLVGAVYMFGFILMCPQVGCLAVFWVPWFGDELKVFFALVCVCIVVLHRAKCLAVCPYNSPHNSPFARAWSNCQRDCC
jgi:hypothetical protein